MATDTAFPQNGWLAGVRVKLDCLMATVIALSLDALHDYRAYLVSVKSKQAFETVSDEQFCLMTNITDKEGRLSYAGLMMFGKGYRVTAYIPTFCVD